MTRRIPQDAFQQYVAMGPSRSYRAVAEHLGVNKRSVTRHAIKHGWQERLAAIEGQAREKADQEMVESYAVVTQRHLKVLRAIQQRALQALQRAPITTGIQAVRALDLAIKSEQVLLRPEREEQQADPTLSELLTRSWECNAGQASRGIVPPQLPPGQGTDATDS
jgi:hypothetical protein